MSAGSGFSPASVFLWIASARAWISARSAANSGVFSEAGALPFVMIWWMLVEIAAAAYWKGMSRIASPPILTLADVEGLRVDPRVVDLVVGDVQRVAAVDVAGLRVVPQAVGDLARGPGRCRTCFRAIRCWYAPVRLMLRLVDVLVPAHRGVGVDRPWPTAVCSLYSPAPAARTPMPRAMSPWRWSAAAAVAAPAVAPLGLGRSRLQDARG